MKSGCSLLVQDFTWTYKRWLPFADSIWLLFYRFKLIEACGDIGEIGDITFSPFRYETVLN